MFVLGLSGFLLLRFFAGQTVTSHDLAKMDNGFIISIVVLF